MCHLYLRGSISDHLDKNFGLYLKKWQICWHFLTENIYSGKKKIFSFQHKNCFNLAKKKDSELWFFASTRRFYNSNWVSQGVTFQIFMSINFFPGAHVRDFPPPKKKNTRRTTGVRGCYFQTSVLSSKIKQVWI